MKLQRPKLSVPKRSAPKLEAPPFLVDVFRDLRDRSLLLPGMLLVVALIAVPVGLSHSAAPAPAPLTSSSTGGKPTSAEPAVFVADTGIRSYRQRLAALKSKNPFTRHFALPKAPTDGTGATGPTGPAGPSSSSPTAPAAPPSGAVTPPSGAASTGVATTPTNTTTTTHTVTVHQRPHRRPVHYYDFVIDVKVGQPDDLTKRTGLKRLTVLPHESRPVVVFLGQTNDGDASFSVSDDVSSVHGDGTCIPGPDACRYLTLKAGDKEKFAYDPDGNTYVLKMLGIRRVRVHPGHHHGGNGHTGHFETTADLGPGSSTGN